MIIVSRMKTERRKTNVDRPSKMCIRDRKYLTIMFREEISDELKASRRLGYENAQLEKTARKTAGKTPDTDEVRQTPDQAENGAKSPQHSEGFQPQNGTKPPWAE